MADSHSITVTGVVTQDGSPLPSVTVQLREMQISTSTDEAGKFLPICVDKGVFDDDPFQSIDQGGVGELVRIAVDKGKKTSKGLHLGICGEHGGDPNSIQFFHTVGLDYVSCGPFRVPIARLAAARANLK